jgi:hypothetical protein
MMILEHYLYTGDEEALTRYFPIVNLTLVFFKEHYQNRTADGKLMIWPAQALETYWCAYSATDSSWTPPYFDGVVGDPHAQSNCVVNDHPNVAALHVLLERVQRLPESIAPASAKAEWATFEALLPDVPVTTTDGMDLVSPYASFPVNSQVHNSETPELYSVHPYRYYSVGRSDGGTRSSTPALNCILNPKVRATCGNSHANGGWTQGVMNAALLGLTNLAAEWVVQRATTGPATGYRFQGFAPHEQE